MNTVIPPVLANRCSILPTGPNSPRTRPVTAHARAHISDAIAEAAGGERDHGAGGLDPVIHRYVFSPPSNLDGAVKSLASEFGSGSLMALLGATDEKHP
jgi:hypothetical protein